MPKPIFRRRFTAKPIHRNPKLKRRSRALIKALIALSLVTVLLLIGFDIAVKRARPIIEVLAVSEARRFVLTSVSEAVAEEVNSGKYNYDSLVTIERADDGSVSALVTDMAKINTLQANVSSRVARQVVNLINTDISVHLGDITGNMILSGRGPRLPVRVQSVASVETSAKNEFSDAGLNQTHHRLSLLVTVTINIIMPGGPTVAVVTNEVAVAESIIVGKVPGIYAK